MNHFDASTGQAYGGIVRFWPGVDSYSYLDNFMADEDIPRMAQPTGLVRSTEWVGDFSRLESATWRWWPRFVPDGTH